MKNLFLRLGTFIKTKLSLAICALALFPAISSFADIDYGDDCGLLEAGRSSLVITGHTGNSFLGGTRPVAGTVYLLDSDGEDLDSQSTNDQGQVEFNTSFYTGEQIYYVFIPNDTSYVSADSSGSIIIIDGKKRCRDVRFFWVSGIIIGGEGVGAF